jgi:hypothetical protein
MISQAGVWQVLVVGKTSPMKISPITLVQDQRAQTYT